jgi:hypothetical protein
LNKSGKLRALAMNEWKESDWFKMWLALARNATERQGSHRDDSSKVIRKARQSAQDVSAEDQIPQAEWEVSE